MIGKFICHPTTTASICVCMPLRGDESVAKAAGPITHEAGQESTWKRRGERRGHVADIMKLH